MAKGLRAKQIRELPIPLKVNAIKYLGNFGISSINGIANPLRGWTVVCTSSGVPMMGVSDYLSIGDVSEFNGESWKKLISNVGGFVPSGVKLLVRETGYILNSPLSGTDNNKIASFTGSSNTPLLSTPIEGDTATVIRSAIDSIFSYQQFVFRITLVTPSVSTQHWFPVSGEELVKIGEVDFYDLNASIGASSVVSVSFTEAKPVGKYVTSFHGSILESFNSSYGIKIKSVNIAYESSPPLGDFNDISDTVSFNSIGAGLLAGFQNGFLTTNSGVGGGINDKVQNIQVVVVLSASNTNSWSSGRMGIYATFKDIPKIIK